MAKIMLDVRDLTTKYVTRFHEDVYAVIMSPSKLRKAKALGLPAKAAAGNPRWR